jgi:hypothetical protein
MPQDEMPADDAGIRFNRFYVQPGREPDQVMIGRLKPILTREEARNMAAYLIFASGTWIDFLREYDELLSMAADRPVEG